VNRLARSKRLVVKIGSALLVDEATGRIRRDWLDALADDVAALRAEGRQVILVSSGAIAVGRRHLGLTQKSLKLEEKQAAAATGQIRLAHAYQETLARHEITVAQVLLTLEDTEERRRHLNARSTLSTLIAMGCVPVINENDTVATSEIRFGDNDRLAALVAHLVHADLLVLLSDVDGLYDGPPSRPGARLVPVVRSEEDLAAVTVGSAGSAGVGTGGMTTKVDAARIATGAGIDVLLTSAEQAAAALAGAEVGTHFEATGKRRPTRLLWLAHATSGQGTLSLDRGAVRAVVERRASLLAAGVTAVDGTFVAGDAVDLLDPDGAVVGRGLVNFDADELPALLGRSTSELKVALGAAYEREVIHRDDLVLL
jgi:glutamate 5-kinase